MDKNSIKKFAVWARRELITRVSQRAVQYEITDKGYGEYDADSVNGRIMSASEKSQRKALVDQIRAKGYEQVMEEVAYTWFNRFSALRFMEVNGYLPSRTRVFTDDNNNFKPQIITDAIDLTIDGLDMEKVYELKDDAKKEEELYKYLLITQCNALSKVLPGMFQKISDYTELLFPDNLLREGSVVQQMTTMIPEDDWKDAVQIIGWLYQYYNTEKKDEVFAALKKNVKITKDNIPAATQLFTPDWIVRYMVENSLGRLWVEGHPNDDLKSKWDYYLEEAEQEKSVQTQLAEIRKEYANLKPEDIRVIDPCSGSGHILAYLFDVLMQIYDSYGYTTREAVDSIVTNNIYGLDIDERAAQLAYFAVMMKARQYDSRFLKRTDDEGNPAVPQPHVFAIEESNNIDSFALEYFCNGDAKLKVAMDTIVKEMHDAKEYGSIITVTPQDWDALYNRFDEIEKDINMYREPALGMKTLVQIAEMISQKYHSVVTNPPYMATSNANAKVNSYVKKNYPNSKADFFAIFMEKCQKLCKEKCNYAMITQHVWMFLSTYEKLREFMLRQDIVNMSHLGARAFEEIAGEVVQTTAFVVRKTDINLYHGKYVRLTDATNQNAKEELFLSQTSVYTASKSRFTVIPSKPITYWAGDGIIRAFQTGEALGKLTVSRNGMKTGDNGTFLRFWWEVISKKIKTDAHSADEAINSQCRWFPYNKGGEARKWYGNNDYIVNWENGGEHIFGKAKVEKRNVQDYPLEMKFTPSGTWSLINTGTPTFRYKECNLSDIAGMSFYNGGENTKYYLGFCNTPIATAMLQLIAPTINYQAGDIGRLPVIFNEEKRKTIIDLVDRNIDASKSEWDSFETSWDFDIHPMLPVYNDGPGFAYKMENFYHLWEEKCEERFNQLKANEEELNRIFIDIYGLQDELTPEVEDKDVTVRKADLERDVKSFISYAVGCMFGRYSLDVDGLAYAGGEWDDSKYPSFTADNDNIIPICDDEYFEDDIVGRFVKFVETVYGEDTLQENLKFIADALGGKGQPKEVIRNYFLNGFYADHCKMYQKRPIYWLFDSGKKNGFKCLIYMHRYQPDTIARIRTDYVHEQQSRYRTALADIDQRLLGASGSEKVKLSKQKTALQAQITEIGEYEEKIHHLADQMIRIDLDDGVKHNYEIFKDVLAKIK